VQLGCSTFGLFRASPTQHSSHATAGSQAKPQILRSTQHPLHCKYVCSFVRPYILLVYLLQSKCKQPVHTGRRSQAESTLQDIEIGSFDPDLDV
jgi:hypothetical protein